MTDEDAAPFVYYESDVDLDTIRSRYPAIQSETLQRDPYADLFQEALSSPIDFRSHCWSLRHNASGMVVIRAVPLEYLVADHPLLCDGYGQDLGQALLANTVVETLDLDPFFFFRYTSANEPSFDPNEAKPLLRFIRTSPSLRTVRLERDFHDHKLVSRVPSTLYLGGEILGAMTINPHIQCFSAQVKIPFDEFVNFLQSSQSIETLIVGIEAITGFASHTESGHAIAKALGASRTLISLTMSHDCEETAAICDEISHQLGTHASLEHLRIHKTGGLLMNPIVGLASLLRSTTVLQTLELSICIDAENAELLVSGLEATRTLKRLELDVHYFTHLGAVTVLSNFLSTKANRNGNVLRALRITVHEATYHDHLSRIMSMGMDSALESLEHEGGCEGDYNYARLFHSVTEMNLQRLWLLDKRVDSGSLQSLAAYIAGTNTLEDLRVTRILQRHDGVGYDSSASDYSVYQSATDLLSALRRNGSIVHVELRRTEGIFSRSVFSWRALRLVDAYMMRNATLPRLVGTTAVNVDTDDPITTGGTPLHLFPTLFAVSQDTRPVTSSRVLAGLLSMSSLVAPLQGDTIRTRAE